jgi:riboflavin biosynthesis pyrimidine reductase
VEAEVPEVAALLHALYGVSALARAGVVHVSSAVRAADGQLHVIKIGPAAPRSETDFFVLNLCRARADAIVTSAAILRSEPTLVLGLQGTHAAALTRYRRDVLFRRAPPLGVILTRGGALPLEHPIWRDGTDKLVLTSPEAQAALADQLGSRAQVVGLAQLDARTATAWLQAQGHALLSVEAGPSTSGPLYRAPSVVGELLLSVYEGELAKGSLGNPLPADRLLFAGRTLLADTAREEESGRWRFQRWSTPAA